MEPYSHNSTPEHPGSKRLTPQERFDQAMQVVEVLGAAIVPIYGIDKKGRCLCGSSMCKQSGSHPIPGIEPTTDAHVIRTWFFEDDAK